MHAKILSFTGIIFALVTSTVSSSGLEGSEQEKVLTRTDDNPSRQFFLQHLPMDPATGKILIPNNVKHVKLDIGLSYSAPMSQYWLSHEDDLMVFGFEPNPAAIFSIRSGAKKRDPSHGDPLDLKYVDSRFYLVPCALGLPHGNTARFYITRGDCGCSSLYEPYVFDVETIIDVPVFSLSDFFEYFPFDSHPVIDYIKIDAQGSDLNIVKSAGQYLKDRVVYITIEADDQHYRNTTNSESDIDIYMESVGFIKHSSGSVQDPTYFNVRFLEYVQNNEIKIYQKG